MGDFGLTALSNSMIKTTNVGKPYRRSVLLTIMPRYIKAVLGAPFL